jgi:hypothetical protein
VREEPIISGAWIKAALVLLVAAALGVGAYPLASDVDINLPDLDLDTTGDETTLSDTTPADTTIGEPEPPPATTNPFTSAGLASALATVRDAVGQGAEVTQVSINDVQSQFFVRRGEGGEAYSVRADSGELQRQEATITITGGATIEDFAFGLDAVRPSAIDRMLPAARKLSGTADFKPTVLNLERRIPAGSRELAWTINAQGGGRNFTYRARANGTGVEDIGGTGTAIPPEIRRAQELNRCIEAAGSDVDAITGCFDRFSPSGS